MYKANIEVTNEQLDITMQRNSWTTSLLMNASGNFKNKITPDKLYTPLDKRTDNKKQKVINKEYVEQQRKELTKKFNI